MRGRMSIRDLYDELDRLASKICWLEDKMLLSKNYDEIERCRVELMKARKKKQEIRWELQERTSPVI